MTQSPSNSTDDEDVDELGKNKYNNIGTFERMIIEEICRSGEFRCARNYLHHMLMTPFDVSRFKQFDKVYISFPYCN